MMLEMGQLGKAHRFPHGHLGYTPAKAAVYNDKGERQCRRCSVFKPDKSFSKEPTREDGLKLRCKLCVRKYGTQNALDRAPLWLADEQWGRIERIYYTARKMTAAYGVKYSVDHIQPLKGKDRCGLHVPWNLHIVLASFNNSKWNKPPEEVFGKGQKMI